MKWSYWVQHGSEACGSVHRWVPRNCPDFEEMKITRVAKCVCARIGHPTDACMGWTSPRNTFVKACTRTNEYSKSMVERIVEFKNYALSVF